MPTELTPELEAKGEKPVPGKGPEIDKGLKETIEAIGEKKEKELKEKMAEKEAALEEALGEEEFGEEIEEGSDIGERLGEAKGKKDYVDLPVIRDDPVSLSDVQVGWSPDARYVVYLYVHVWSYEGNVYVDSVDLVVYDTKKIVSKKKKINFLEKKADLGNINEHGYYFREEGSIFLEVNDRGITYKKRVSDPDDEYNYFVYAITRSFQGKELEKTSEEVEIECAM